MVTDPDAPQPKRVLFVIHTVEIGGMETFSVDLASELVRRGITVTVVFPENEAFDLLEEKFVAGGCVVRRMSTDHTGSRLAQVKSVLRFTKLVRSVRPEVVHMHTGGAAGGLAVAGAIRLSSRARLVMTEHSVPDPSPPRWHRVTRPVLDRVMDSVVCVSRRNARLRKERIGAHAPHFAAILNGIPLSPITDDERARARTEIRRQHELGDDTFVVGCLVRMAGDKGIDDLLGAIAKSTVPDMRLLLVGDGPLRDKFEALAAELQISDRVVFAGYRRNTRDYLAAFDLFALAVPVGSMSIAVLEALGLGTATMITFCGPEEAVIPDVSGFCAPPRDPAGLAAAIDRIAASPEETQRIAALGAKHVAKHFSISRVADDYLQVYRTKRRQPLADRLQADGPLNAYP